MISDRDDSHELKLSVQRRIEKVRPAVKAILKRPPPSPSEATVKQYLAACERMLRQFLPPECIGANSRRSFNLYRAAIVYRYDGELREAWQRLDERDGLITTRHAHHLLNRIEICLAFLKRYPPSARDAQSLWCRPEKGPTRKGKRIGLSRLPANWRVKMLSACPSGHEYHNAMLLSALSGLRPAELKKGVVVHATVDGVKISIEGAKVTEIAGQPKRQLWFQADNRLVRGLLDQITASGKDRLIVSIQDKRKYCDYIRRLSKCHFPNIKYVASPYSFRHQFAADQKADGVSAERIAQMLGHVSERSQQRYGVARQGRTPLAMVKSVETSRPVYSLSKANKPWQTKPSPAKNGQHFWHS